MPSFFQIFAYVFSLHLTTQAAPSTSATIRKDRTQDMPKPIAPEAPCSTGASNASLTKTAESRCKLTLEKSKLYWALIVCKHCREYTTCRSAFTCYSKVAHHSEVVLVDGKEARNKVGILSEGQPGFPSTEGRELGDIVELDFKLVEAGVVCTVGCTECAGLPLKECIDAGHYQQVRFNEGDSKLLLHVAERPTRP